METVMYLEPEELEALRDNGLLSEVTPYYNDLYLLTPKALEFIENMLDSTSII